MPIPPIDILREACAILEPVLCTHGFQFQIGGSGCSCGGLFAFGAYINADRKLVLHYRASLGLMVYHFRSLSLDHDSYMRVLAGPEGGNRYPSFSEDPLAPFEGLRFDLEHFASAFLLDHAQEFAGCVRDAEKWKSTKGFARLP